MCVHAHVALDSIYTELFSLPFDLYFLCFFGSFKFHRRHMTCSIIWYQIDSYVHSLYVLPHSVFILCLFLSAFYLFSGFELFFPCFRLLTSTYGFQTIKYQSSSLLCRRLAGHFQINFIDIAGIMGKSTLKITHSHTRDQSTGYSAVQHGCSVVLFPFYRVKILLARNSDNLSLFWQRFCLVFYFGCFLFILFVSFIFPQFDVDVVDNFPYFCSEII